MSKISIAVLASGGGTNLQSIIDGIEAGDIPAIIDVVISGNDEAFALDRAKRHGIEGVYIGKINYPSLEERSNKLKELLSERRIDLVVLAGYMEILDRDIIREFENRIMNIHPSLIPSFCGKGFYGERVHRAVVDYGAKITGATVHFVDEGTDTGPIILQEAVHVLEDDTVKSLAQRVLAVEHRLLPKAVKLFAEGKLRVEGRKVRIKKG